MSVINSIMAVLEAIPKLIDLVDRISKQISADQYRGWISEVDKATAELEKATSLKEKVDAAKRLRDLTASAKPHP